jgi:hypothetical protein
MRFAGPPQGGAVPMMGQADGGYPAQNAFGQPRGGGRGGGYTGAGRGRGGLNAFGVPFGSTGAVNPAFGGAEQGPPQKRQREY